MDILCDEIQRVYQRVFLIYDKEGNVIRGRLEKEYDLVINIPPGTSKSTIVSVMAPAWSWACDPTLRHITASYSGSLSTEMATKSRDIVRSPKYRLYFPEVQIKSDEDGKTNYKTIHNGQRYATSVGGTITGIHAHIITVDDPLNTKQSTSLADVQTANTWFDTTLPTRKVDKKVTPTILIMQRLATNDPSGHILDKAKKGLRVRHICLPAEISKDVRPRELKAQYIDGLLDPVRMPTGVLKEMRISLGAAGYAGQFDQRPTPAGGLIWQKWFKPIPDASFPDRSLMTAYGNDWDLAYTDDEENSASAYVTSGRIGHNIYIDDLDFRWLEFPQLIAWMKSKRGVHYIEAKASGKSAKQTLHGLGITAVEVKVQGGDKIARANMATPKAEAGFVFIRQSLLDKLYNDSKQGILFFPKGANTDLADALAQALQRHANTPTITEGKDDDEDNQIDLLDL